MNTDTIAMLPEIQNTIWAIMPEHLDNLVVQIKLGKTSACVVDEPLDGMLAEKYEAATKRLPTARGGAAIAVLPVRGVITQHGMGDMFDFLVGGTRLDALGEVFDRLIADKAVGAIVLDIDSPGGVVYGVTEMAAKIRAARGVKPVVAVANSVAASAAYAIASAAETLVATPSGVVGSIGILQFHTDTTAAEEAEGIKTTVISAGEHKAERLVTLNDDAKAAMQQEVDARYATFLSDVAKGRGVTATVVRQTYGKGRTVNASDALAVGMVDRVATLDEVLAGMSRSKTPKRDRAERQLGMMDM